jgi:hypothetical protein
MMGYVVCQVCDWEGEAEEAERNTDGESICPDCGGRSLIEYEGEDSDFDDDLDNYELEYA